jgi:hypothetical protein
MTLAMPSDSFEEYCQTVQGSVLNIHLFFYQQNQSFKMKKNLKSLLSEANIQVLVADDMSVIKGGGGNGGHGGGKSGGGHGHGKSGGGHGHGKSGHGHGKSGKGGGWGGSCPPRSCPPPRPRC